MKKIIIMMLWLLVFCSVVSAAGYYRTYAIEYDDVDVKSDMVLDGNYYLVNSTDALSAIVDNDEDPLLHSDIAFQSGTNYPLKLYNGDLRIVTQGNGITFPDGSLQTTAGVGSLLNTLSSTGEIIINSDSDDSGDESILFRTNGATPRMILEGGSGDLGIGTINPQEAIDIYRDENSEIGMNIINNDDVGSDARTHLSLGVGVHTGEISFQGDNYTGILDDIFRPASLTLMTGNSGGINICATNAFGEIHFFTGGQDATKEHVIIDRNGLMGIGTTDPQGLLDVYGTLTIASIAELNYLIPSFQLEISTNLKVNGNIEIAPVSRYYTVSGSDFMPENDSTPWQIYSYVESQSLSAQRYIASIHLPDNAIIKSATTHWYKPDAADIGVCEVTRTDIATGIANEVILETSTTAATGYSAITDNTPDLAYNVVNTQLHTYFCFVYLDPNITANGMKHINTVIEYEITEPLP